MIRKRSKIEVIYNESKPGVREEKTKRNVEKC